MAEGPSARIVGVFPHPALRTAPGLPPPELDEPPCEPLLDDAPPLEPPELDPPVPEPLELEAPELEPPPLPEPPELDAAAPPEEPLLDVPTPEEPPSSPLFPSPDPGSRATPHPSASANRVPDTTAMTLVGDMGNALRTPSTQRRALPSGSGAAPYVPGPPTPFRIRQGVDPRNSVEGSKPKVAVATIRRLAAERSSYYSNK